jgi:predicted alpha/beta-hydrolase family hydrolase
MRTLNRILLITILILIVAAAGLLAWANNPSAPMPEAITALQSDSQVQVTEDGWITFQPTSTQPDTGLILYPGGRVDPRAYAPIARLIAEQGYMVVIVPMPHNLAVFGSNRAQDVIAAYPEIQHWAIGGHSLGGAMAARFASRHPGAIQGLVLWAAYPANSDDLSGQDLQVLSMIGDRDGLGTKDGVEATRQLLPENTTYLTIEGGNHAQFGWYGAQPGDAEATISRPEQQAQVLQATLQLLASLK